MAKTEEKTIHTQQKKLQNSCECSEKKLCDDPDYSSPSHPKTMHFNSQQFLNMRNILIKIKINNSTSKLVSTLMVKHSKQTHSKQKTETMTIISTVISYLLGSNNIFREAKVFKDVEVVKKKVKLFS